MKKIYFLFRIFIFHWAFFLSASAQTAPMNLDVFPATPNAAALAKFGNTPVSLATGVPSINVPIYSYSRNGLNLNVSLDYHAGGIRVEEVASDVGIGWALNAGGNISRTVRGWPDDLKDRGYFFFENLRSFSHYLVEAFHNDDWALTSKDSLWLFYKNLKDSQSDIFNYSFNGKSGKFIYGKDGSYKTIPQSNIKIERIIDLMADNHYSLVGFVITDVDGTKYEFRQHDKIYNSSLNTFTAYSYATSWSLTKIVAPYQTDSIKLEYENSYLQYQTGVHESIYTHLSGYYEDIHFDDATYSIGEYEGTVKRLKKISFPDSTHLNFNYNTVSRRDINGGGALKDISIVNGEQSYGHRLYQSYGTNGTYTAGSVSANYRLQLDSVVQFSGDKYLRPYKFTYNGVMPSRLSPGQDHWGFVNSLTYSGTMIPKIVVSSDTAYTGADRRANPIYAQTGILTAIRYPSGGTTNFTYESNVGDVKLDILETETKGVSLGDYGVTERSFVLNRLSNTSQTFNFTMYEWCPGNSTSCSYIYKIKSLDGLTTYAEQQLGYADLNVTKKVNVANIPNGTYKVTWEYHHAGTCSCNDNFSFYLSWNQFKVDTSRIAGGVRIKKIVDYDGISHDHDQIKEYDYNYVNGSSSGSVIMLPEYSFKYKSLTASGSYWSEFLYRTSSTQNPLSNVNGAPVNYKMVTVKQKEGSGYAGKIIHEFTDHLFMGIVPCLDDQGGNCPPFVTQTIKDYGVGLPLTESIFDKDNNLLKKRKLFYNKIDVDGTDIDNFGSFKFIITEQQVNSEINITFSPADFYVQTGRVEKTEERTVDYFGTDSLVNHNYYFYDDHYNLKRTYTFNSSNEKIETKYYYPYDYTLTGAIGHMRDLGIISPVISMEKWLTDNSSASFLVEGSIADYGFYQGQIIRPSKYYKLNALQPISTATAGVFNPGILNRIPTYYQQEVSYDKYDTKGNLNQYTVKNDLINVILWGYNQQQAVAKAMNADSASVAYTSFEDAGNGNWTIGSNNRPDIFAKTGTRCYSLATGNISKVIDPGLTYIVSYWSRNGSYTITNSGTPKQGESTNGWTYYEHRVTGTSNLSISGVGYIDELRLYPVSAEMITYTYNPNMVTAVTDAKNSSTYYRYDSFNRLSLVSDNRKDILKQFDYNYIGERLPNWQNTSTTLRCKLNGNGQNTGEQEQEQRDINPSSPNYNQTRWIVIGTNTGACPLPQACNPITCNNGTNQKCVNGNCETGIKVYTDSIYNWSTMMYTCYYHYEFSDGSWSSTYTEESELACAF